jgi:hypothetical protein
LFHLLSEIHTRKAERFRTPFLGRRFYRPGLLLVNAWVCALGPDVFLDLFGGESPIAGCDLDATELLVSDQFVDTFDADTQNVGYLCTLEQRRDINKA